MKNESIIRKKWNRGKKATIFFYYKKSRWKFESFNRIFPLFDYFGPMIGNKTDIKIADLGAGLVSTTGSTWPNTKVKLYPSDALAGEFNQFLKEKDQRWGEHLENGYKPLFPVDQQDMENLTYEDNFFDIVHCVNALDHCADPFKAIKEMYRVCKPGGWIYLRHFPDNAKLQRYHGLHQWNISPKHHLIPFESTDCLFENIFGDKFLLSECVPGFEHELRPEIDVEKSNMVISKLQK